MSISIIPSASISAATSLITGTTWAPESAYDVLTATLLTGTVLPNMTCSGHASPTQGVWLAPANSLTLEPLNQTTLDYAVRCCKGAGIYYFIDRQCADQISTSGLFCQPIEQTLTELDTCFKNGTNPANGIGSLVCNGNEDECDHTAPVRGVSTATVKTSSNMNSSPTVDTQPATTIATPSASAASNAAPRLLKVTPPVLAPHGDGATGTSKVVVAFGVAWAVAIFAGLVAM